MDNQATVEDFRQILLVVEALLDESRPPPVLSERTLRILRGASPRLAWRYALRRVPPPVDRRLTRREWEIARWIWEGKFNDEIAKILFLSKRTVDNHCANILRKLGLPNRMAVVRWYGEVLALAAADGEGLEFTL